MSQRGGKREGAGRKPRLGVPLVHLPAYVTPDVKDRVMARCHITGETPGDLLAWVVKNKPSGTH